MTSAPHQPNYKWSQAKSLMPRTAQYEKGPQGALIPDTDESCDHIAVVYDEGENPPEITIKHVSGTVHTVLADGIAVAIIAKTSGKVPNVSDVVLVERRIHG